MEKQQKRGAISASIDKANVDQIAISWSLSRALFFPMILIANYGQLIVQQMVNKSIKSKISLIPLVLLVLTCVPATAQAFTPLEVDTMITTIDNLFFSQTPRFRMDIRKFLRAAFHDCMGGCDGSLNLANSANRGLQKYVEILDKAYSQLQDPRTSNYAIFKRLSRADFWVLCEQRALAMGMQKAGYAPVLSGPVFSYGRISADSSNNDPSQATFPDGVDSWQSMLANINTGIKVLSERDIVALLGLHGAGTATLNNSGFSGPWGPSTDKNVVNNNFFINLVSYGYPGSNFKQIKAVDAPSPPTTNTPTLDGDYQSSAPTMDKIQWQRSSGNSGAKMMLPIDMEIYLSLTPNATGGQTEGEYCPQGFNASIYDCTNINSPTHTYLPRANNAGLALSYAQNANLFYIDLVSAFNKMVSYTSQNTFLTPFAPSWSCVGSTAVCLGNLLLSGCAGIAPSCP